MQLPSLVQKGYEEQESFKTCLPWKSISQTACQEPWSGHIKRIFFSTRFMQKEFHCTFYLDSLDVINPTGEVFHSGSLCLHFKMGIFSSLPFLSLLLLEP